MKYTKKNRPKYFNKLPTDVQAARATIELSNEIKNEPVVHQHHEPTFREIQEDKVKLNG